MKANTMLDRETGAQQDRMCASTKTPTPLRNEASRVLVVEDNADLARLMTMLLRHCGFDVLTLNDGLGVVASARSFRPDFLLLDIGLPGLDGYQVAEQIRREPDLDTVVIIAISAYLPDAHDVRSRSAKFDYRLVKPVDFQDLMALIGASRSGSDR